MVGYLDKGNYSISSNPYMNDYFINDNFGSSSKEYISAEVNWYINSNILFYQNLYIGSHSEKQSEISFRIGLNFFYQKDK